MKINEMTKEEAKRILHPDTTSEALREYKLDDREEAVEKACLIACEALEEKEDK